MHFFVDVLTETLLKTFSQPKNKHQLNIKYIYNKNVAFTVNSKILAAFKMTDKTSQQMPK